MNRRTFLASSGALLGGALGGCTAQSDTPGGTDESTDEPQTNTPTTDPTGTPTDEPTDRPTNTPSESGVVVEDVVVRKAVAYESIMGSGGVLAGPDRQYVVASVRVPPDVSDPEFTFEADDRGWTPGLPDTHGGNDYAVAGHEGGPVDASLEGDRSFLAFTVPSPLDVSDPRIRLAGGQGATWPLSGAGVDRLAAAGPRFELDALAVPDEVSQGDPLSVSLTVRNVSEVDGRFLAALYWPTEGIADDDESHPIEKQVPAGETVTASTSIDTEYTAFDPGPVSLRVEGHVETERSVRLTDVGTTN